MKVLLINPPISRNTSRRLGPIVRNLFYNSAPLGLGYLAAALQQAGHEVKIIDAAAEGIPIDSVVQRTGSFLPDIAGISTYTVSSESSYGLAQAIRQRFPGIKIIAGGPHITSNPQELLDHPEFDAAVLGEGEITFGELVKALEKKLNLETVKGIAYSSGNRLFFSSPRELIPDLDTLPLPARSLLPLALYKPQPNDQKRLPKVSMISSRGCPHPCIFCDKNVFKNRYRSFSPGYIVKEMAVLVNDFKARDIAFVDSTFTPDKDRVYKIVQEIKKTNLDVSWTCSVRADIVDSRLLKEMKDAGCWRVRLGAESGNDEVLKFIKKGITKYQIRNAAQWAYELDLEPKAFFMIGHLNDTKQTIEETIDFACSLPIKDITVQINTPLKNTPQYLLAQDYGKITAIDNSAYSFFEPVFLPRGLTRRDILYYYVKFYLQFYLRPQVWRRHAVKIRSFSDIIKYFKGASIIFFFLISWLKKKL